MEQIELKLEKISGLFMDMATLFESVKMEFQTLKNETINKNDGSTQTVWSNSRLNKGDEENYFRIGHSIVQNTRSIELQVIGCSLAVYCCYKKQTLPVRYPGYSTRC